MDRDVSEDVPPWLKLASWGFWLAVTAAALGLFVQTLANHRADAAAGARDWHLRVEICKRLSKAPRPPWWECHARAAQSDDNLLAPRSPDAQARPRTGLAGRGS